jgi:hypothetical protein
MMETNFTILTTAADSRGAYANLGRRHRLGGKAVGDAGGSGWEAANQQKVAATDCAYPPFNGSVEGASQKGWFVRPFQ